MYFQFINVDSYRLGAAGFMTSKELRDAGYKANNGFHDQRTALQWIRNNIGGFGGEPDEITTVGESAGGCESIFTESLFGTDSASVCNDDAVLREALDEAVFVHGRRRTPLCSLPFGSSGSILPEARRCVRLSR